MKFLVDMPLPASLSEWLGNKGHDAVHAFDAGLGRAPDAAILEHARKEGRVVMTADLDYPRLLALTGEQGPGLILFRGGSFSDREAMIHLERLMQTVSEEDLKHSIVVLEKGRIRRRRLPV